MRTTGLKAAHEVITCELSNGVGRAEAFGELAGDAQGQGSLWMTTARVEYQYKGKPDAGFRYNPEEHTSSYAIAHRRPA